MSREQINQELSCIEAYIAGKLTESIPGSDSAKRYLEWLNILNEARRLLLEDEHMEDDGK